MPSWREGNCFMFYSKIYVMILYFKIFTKSTILHTISGSRFLHIFSLFLFLLELLL